METKRWLAAPALVVAATLAATLATHMVVFVREGETVAVIDTAPAAQAEDRGEAGAPETDLTALLGPGLHLISPWRETARIAKTEPRVAALALDPPLADGGRCPAELRVIYTLPDPVAVYRWRREIGAPASDGAGGDAAHTLLAEEIGAALSAALRRAQRADAEQALRARIRAETRRRRGRVEADGSRLERIDLLSLGCATALLAEPSARPDSAAPAAPPPPPLPDYGRARRFLVSSYRPPGAAAAARDAEAMLRVAPARPLAARTRDGAPVLLEGVAAHVAILDRRRFEEAFSQGVVGEAHAKLSLRVLLESAMAEAVRETPAAKLGALDLRKRLGRPGGAFSGPMDRLHAGVALVAIDLAEAQYRLSE